MTVSADYLQYVLDQLTQLAGVSSRRMFSGVGLYCDELFFGLLHDDTLYLRADDSNRADYTARGMAQFRPYVDRPHVSMHYYEAPADVLEDARQLAEWARRSVAVAVRAAATKRAPGAATPRTGSKPHERSGMRAGSKPRAGPKARAGGKTRARRRRKP